jgi:DNA invertase Pin-like site-specific DNA recombinase
MIQVAIYIRGLRDEETRQKREALIKIAYNNSWRGDMFNEETAGVSTWPVKVKLLQKLRNQQYKGLLIFNLESWARNTTELILEFDEFIRKGIFIYSASENLFLIPDSGDSSTKTLIDLALFERAWIEKKRRIAIELSKSDGRKLGRPCGSKDKVKRKTEGYLKREALKRNLKALRVSNIYSRP